MEICITGYSGFVGSYIIKKLPKKFSIRKINLRKIPILETGNYDRYLNKFNKANIIINFASAIYPKTKHDFLIFIGNSGGIIEALERGSKVVQIVEFPLFDIYSNKIWPSIIRKKINENIFVYSLRKKGNLIKLGNKKKIKFNFDNL